MISLAEFKLEAADLSTLCLEEKKYIYIFII